MHDVHAVHQVRASGDRIAEARFKVFGCKAAIASADLVAEWLEGLKAIAASEQLRVKS